MREENVELTDHSHAIISLCFVLLDDVADVVLFFQGCFLDVLDDVTNHLGDITYLDDDEGVAGDDLDILLLRRIYLRVLAGVPRTNNEQAILYNFVQTV